MPEEVLSQPKETPVLLDPEQLRASNWNRTFGTLTLGFAHDLNNLLTGLLCSSEALLSQTDATHPWHKILDRILSNSQKASQLLQQLSQLHTARLGQPMYHDLNEVARRAAEVGRRAVPRRIDFELALDSGTLPVHLDGAELLQVLLGVVISVGELVSKGKLVFRTSAQEEPPRIGAAGGALPNVPFLCCGLEAGPVTSAPNLETILAQPLAAAAQSAPALGVSLLQAVQFAKRNAGALVMPSTQTELRFCLWLPRATFSDSGGKRGSAGT